MPTKHAQSAEGRGRSPVRTPVPTRDAAAGDKSKQQKKKNDDSTAEAEAAAGYDTGINDAMHNEHEQSRLAGAHGLSPASARKARDAYVARQKSRGASPDSLKSYWYPDRAADKTAVLRGLRAIYARLLGLAFVTLVAGSLAIVVVAWQRQAELLLFVQAVREAWMHIVASGVVAQHSDTLYTLAVLLAAAVVVFVVFVVWWAKRSTPVYLVDFALYQPPDKNKAPAWKFMHNSKLTGWFTDDGLEFQEKLLGRTGLGDETYFPDAMHETPPTINMERSRAEAMQVFTGCIDELFQRTGMTAKQIDFVIVNCSLFNPTPSLAAMVMNKYKMRSDCKNYNLAGMGCSAGVISIDLAKDLLQVYPNVNILVLSTENITQNWYRGKDKSKLISNTLFRMGGAAMLLSNKWSDSWRAKYRLKHLVRVHKAADDVAYRCVFQEEDSEGIIGVTLSKDLLKVAGGALKQNITVLGAMALPYSEQIKFLVNAAGRKLGFIPRNKPYVPDFKKAFNHFCIHAGGRAIIDGLEENLKLTPWHTEPSRATLYRYGNTSSSSIWYELLFLERDGRVKRGHQVLQIALGSGFKCNSAVWERM